MRYTRSNISPGFSASQLNNELSKIESAINDTLSRVGDQPDEMRATLDMNSNRIINLPDPISGHEPITVDSGYDVFIALGFIDEVIGGTHVVVDDTNPNKPIVNVPDIGVESIVPGIGVLVDSSDPAHPVVSADTSVTGVTEVVAGENILVDNTAPHAPVVSLSDVITGDIEFSDDATFDDWVTMNSNLFATTVSVSGNHSVSGASILLGTLSVGNAVSFGSPNFNINSVSYRWPDTQGDPNTVLTNSGTGVLTWEPMGSTGIDVEWETAEIDPDAQIINFTGNGVIVNDMGNGRVEVAISGQNNDQGDVYSVNGHTGTVVIDYPDLAGAGYATLNNNIAFRGREVGGIARNIAYIDTSDQVHIGSPSSVVHIYSEGVPFVTYDGTSHTMVTVEADGQAGNVLTTDGSGNYIFQPVDISGVVEDLVAGDNIDIDATDPANPIVNLRNPLIGPIDVTGQLNTTEAMVCGTQLYWGNGVHKLFSNDGSGNSGIAFGASVDTAQEDGRPWRILTGNDGNTGDFQIQCSDASVLNGDPITWQSCIECEPNGSTSMLFNGNSKLETTSAGIAVNGRVDISGTDGAPLRIENTDSFGAAIRLANIDGGADLQLNADESFSVQQLNSSGTFESNWIQCFRGAAVRINFNGGTRLVTTSSGVDVNGTLSADSLTLTNEVPSIELPDGWAIGTGANLFQVTYNEGNRFTISPTGATQIRYGSDVKLQTSNTGISVSGTANAYSFATTASLSSEVGFSHLRGSTQPARIVVGNSEGGVSLRTDGGSFQLYQTNSSGTTQDIWISGNKDGGVSLRYNNSAKLSTTNAGVTITGTATVNGAITCTGDITGLTSDERTKDIHSFLDPAHCLESVGTWRPIRYSFNGAVGIDPERSRIGLVAQDIQREYPELTPVHPQNGYLTLEYDKSIAVLVGAVQELKAQVEALKQEIKEMKQ